MKFKGIELNGTYKIIYYDTSFEVYNEKDKLSYYEESNGYWEKWEYDKKGNVIYWEDCIGFWLKREYDKKGNVIYFENRNGIIIDKRVKEFNEHYESGLNKGLAVDEPKINIDYEKSVPPIERVKELTIEQIENLLGYKIKIKEERK